VLVPPSPPTPPAGFIGTLRLQIPWSSLRTKSIVVEIQDLYVLVGPPSTQDYSADAETAREEHHKREQLALLETQIYLVGMPTRLPPRMHRPYQAAALQHPSHSRPRARHCRTPRLRRPRQPRRPARRSPRHP
jgi:hypothetical protein